MTQPLHIIFVCHGNICRSPTAERVAQKWAADQGLHDVVFTSAATSREDIGHPIDPRSRRVLISHGYRAAGHAAHRITVDEIENADLVLGMEKDHLERMKWMLDKAGQHVDEGRLGLLSDFNPAVAEGTPLEDPYCGSDAGFEDTLREIEACMPGLMDWIRAHTVA